MIRRLLSVAMLMLVGGSTALAAPGPDPRHSPREVVAFQLEALRQVDQPTPNAGFVTVFGFASPGNREQTGPVDRFAKMIREGYGELVNHRSARILETVQQGDEALQPVEVTSRAGRVYRYVFILRRVQESPYQGCWMTDGVVQPDDAGQSRET